MPDDWNDDWSPSTLTARPFSTVTHTPHSILPQPRQHVRTRLISLPRLGASASSASAAPGTAHPMTAVAAVAADSLAKVRRLKLSLPISPPFSLILSGAPDGSPTLT